MVYAVKILHLIYDHINNPWVGGGGAVRVYEIYKRLSQRHEITVVCGMYPDAADYNEESLRFHFVGTDRNNYVLSAFCYAARAVDFLRKNSGKFDVVIEDFAPYNPVFSFIFSKRRTVLQVHHKEGFNLFKRYFVLGIPFMFVEAMYPGYFSNVISVSEQTKEKLKLRNAFILSNAIDGSLFCIEPQDGEYIAYVGRIHIYNKGLDTLIKAMDLVDAELKIAGRGTDEIALKQSVRGSNKIKIAGYLAESEKLKFIANSKFIVVPSRYEGQGIVVLEAAACGKPVVVSDIPELRYAVDAGFGISFKTADAIDLAKKVKYLIENKVARDEMGQKGREYAKNFTWDKIAVEYEQYLEKVAGANND
jgi:glycosyltransferase involved in cell wall biosynthesis